ncbi:hypothetical protein [Loktanella sp. 3ANDIMAR09]|uniref:hypothetical protein n=1 Tax=Loktanella sp. 3ANDIMAR09 TaxID=1225657 RepID=UPI001C1031E8|nr:hypothetical protein [Loktanella sp. 3ANDIMAR09]
MVAVDNRAASVAAFEGIQRSPRVRPLPERTRCAHHTHTASVLLPHPVQRQEDGGVWVEVPQNRGIGELSRFNKFLIVGRNRLPLTMPRLSIVISLEDHQKLKAIAALKGQSIKDYVLGRALGDAPALDGMSEDEAFMALANFLEPRIKQARRGALSGKSPDEVCLHRCQRDYIFWLAIDRPIIIAVLHEKMDAVQRLNDRL